VLTFSIIQYARDVDSVAPLITVNQIQTAVLTLLLHMLLREIISPDFIIHCSRL